MRAFHFVFGSLSFLLIGAVLLLTVVTWMGGDIGSGSGAAPEVPVVAAARVDPGALAQGGATSLPPWLPQPCPDGRRARR